jgi:hypothetical protein
VQRQLTAPQFRLAGGGWYETDFKSDGDKKRNLADPGGGDKSDSAKTEPKPAEAKPVESKPAESKPAAAAKPDTQSAPKVDAKPAATAG